jgi:diguanylate cyclase (GGDEF)-like protein
MTVNNQSGKFGRKIFISFVLAAIIPVTLLTLLSTRFVVNQLKEQRTQALRFTAKKIGMDFIGDLERQKNTLKEIAAGLSIATKESSIKAVIATLPKGEINSLVHIQASKKKTKSLLGKASPPKTSLETIRKQLNKLPALLFHEQESLFLAVAIGTETKPSNDLLIAELNIKQLLPIADHLPPDIDACLLLNDRVISCTQSDSAQNSMMNGQTDSLTANWPIFLGGQFTHDEWSSVVYQDKTVALAPIKKFFNVLPPVMLLALLIVAFFTMRFLNNTLKPLKQLHEAAKQVSDGDLSTQVEIDTGDEFSQLGGTFNQMANHLRMQFQRMEVMSEIDRMILSTLDIGSIVKTILQRSCDIVSCQQVTVILFNDDEQRQGVLYKTTPDENRSIEKINTVLPVRIGVELEIEEDGNLVFPESDPWIQDTGFPAIPDQPLNWHAIPIKNAQRTFGLLWFGFIYDAVPTPAELEQMCNYTDRITVAVANAAWEKRLYKQAHYDALTGLPNRQLLNDHLNLSINRAKRQNTCVAILFVDLDDFKTVNDSFGHSAGDQMLKVIAQRLTQSLRSIDIVVRFGGDEFIVIISDIEETPLASYIKPVIIKLQEIIGEPVTIKKHSIQPTASIGVAFYPEDATTGSALIQHADAAMYEAKAKGRGHWACFSQDQHASLIKRINLEQDLRKAVTNDQLELFYQPQIDSQTGRIKAAEALVRWNHPEYGFIQPDEFIGLAEDTGLINPIGEWVIRTACEQTALWHELGYEEIQVAVNISARQFTDCDLVAVIQESLLSNNLKAEYLEIEITEQSVMNDVSQTLNVLRRLQDIGVRTAIDDFGTGYSSLSYLQQFPINTLKIDRTFTQEITKSQDGREIVAAIITLAHALHLQIVAEGVETQAEQEILQELNCELLQGFLFSKPVPVPQFEKLLETDKNPDQILSPDPNLGISAITSN